MSRILTAVVVSDFHIVVGGDFPACSFYDSDLAIIIVMRVFSKTKYVKYKNKQKIIYQ